MVSRIFIVSFVLFFSSRQFHGVIGCVCGRQFHGIMGCICGRYLQVYVLLSSSKAEATCLVMCASWDYAPRCPADRPVEVGSGVNRVAARTEQHHVGRCSVEAFVDGRCPGGDQFDLRAAEGPVAPNHLLEVFTAVHTHDDSHTPCVVFRYERQRAGHVGS